jgi:hypothetical protein
VGVIEEMIEVDEAIGSLVEGAVEETRVLM